MFGTLIITVFEILLIVLGALIVLALLAQTHPASLFVVSRLVHLPITPFEWLLQMVTHVLEGLGRLIGTALHDLHHRHGDHEEAWAGWTIVASLCSFGFFLGLAVCDFYNTLVKLGPLAGISQVPYDPVLFSYSLGISFVIAYLVLGWGIADVFGLSPVSMYKKLSDSEKRILRRVMLGTMILALLTTVLLMLLAVEVKEGSDDPILFGFVFCFYAVLILICTFLAGLPLFAAIASAYILGLGAIRFCFWLGGCVLYLPYRLLIVAHDLLIQLLDLLAMVGKLLWNRIAPRHPLEGNAHPELPRIEVLAWPQLTAIPPSHASMLKQSRVEAKQGEGELESPESIPPADAA